MAAIVSNGGEGTWGGNYFTSIDTKRGITTTLCHYKYREIYNVLMAQLEDKHTLPFTLHPAHLPAVYLGKKGRKLGEIGESNHRGSTVLLQNMDRSELDNLNNNLNIEEDAKKALKIQEKCVGLLIRLGEIIDMSRFLIDMINTISKDELCVFEGALNKIFDGMGKAIIKMVELDIQDLQDMRRKTEMSLSWAKSVQDSVSVPDPHSTNDADSVQLEVQAASRANKLNTRIAQQNTHIALESKRDTSAMKAIAVLTMIFLPGTFFAVSSSPFHALNLLIFAVAFCSSILQLVKTIRAECRRPLVDLSSRDHPVNTCCAYGVVDVV